MQFEVFSKHAAAATDERRLTIQKGGAITLNTASYVALGRPRAVMLTYDEVERVLTLCGADRPSDAAASISRVGRAPGGPWIIGASAILRRNDIGTVVSQRWSPRLVDDCLQIDFDEPHARSNNEINSPDTFAPDIAPRSRPGLADNSRAPMSSSGEGVPHDRT